jgi:hypothetical protein
MHLTGGQILVALELIALAILAGWIIIAERRP